MKALGLQGAKPAATPDTAERDDSSYDEDDVKNPVLSNEETTLYRAVAARLNYMCSDRPDLRVSTVRRCQHMASPRRSDLQHLKRIGRYLLHRPRARILFQWQLPSVLVEGYADSDWAGDRISRKSVSGGVLMNGVHVIKTWSTQQSVVATSSAEAELYALNKVSTEALGLKSYLQDLGRHRSVRTHSDSSSALSLVSKIGLGKAKHIELQHLWLQQAIKSGRLSCIKISTDINPADLLTKHLTQERVEMLMRRMLVQYVGGS